MITMTSSKATPNPMMVLRSVSGNSDFWPSWEPWRRRIVMGEDIGPTPPSPPPCYLHPADTHQHHQPQLQQLGQGVLVIPDRPGHRAPLRPEGRWHPPGFLLTLLPTPRAAPLTHSAGQWSRPTHLRRQSRHRGRNGLGPWNGAEVKPAAQNHQAGPSCCWSSLLRPSHRSCGHSPSRGFYVLNVHNVDSSPGHLDKSPAKGAGVTEGWGRGLSPGL